MKPLPSLTEFMNTPDFWLFLLCYSFMDKDKFNELLESIKQQAVPSKSEKFKGGDYHESRTESS